MMTTIIRQPGWQDYSPVMEAMQDYTVNRLPDTNDQIWLLQHNPVYTLGLNADPSHVLEKTNIPVIKTDRGGQVTYHGPGQLIVYLLLDLQRLNIRIKQYISLLEQAMIDLCKHFQIVAERKSGAPGIYVNNKKIGALGIRIKKGYCYHGIAINVNMDLDPFKYINPCGFENLEVTQLSNLGSDLTVEETSCFLLPILSTHLGLNISDNINYNETGNQLRGKLVA